MNFRNEKDFEDLLVAMLPTVGWEDSVLENYDEARLLQNWADILFENNRGIDRLNDFPLTNGEMQQILEQVKELKTPLRLNGFINGGSVQIRRDNPEDTLHFGKEISLKIYNRKEIAAGQSRYQIARQPRFSVKSKILNDRRGDVLLLINGMPVIHIELKRSGVPVSQACNQIQKYAAEGCFTGLFSLVQVFVAMNPEEALYFANPGPEGKFNPDYYFHWADFHNEPINMWDKFTRDLLSIPMAHQLIGFYTVADDSDGILKVTRTYQYQAANAIPAKVAGVNEIVMITPPTQHMNIAVLAAAQIAGVDRVIAVGGAHGIAALTYGAGFIPKVDKIVGPGNAYVAAAKRMVYGQVDIDMIAGPSEVLIIADKRASTTSWHLPFCLLQVPTWPKRFKRKSRARQQHWSGVPSWKRH